MTFRIPDTAASGVDASQLSDGNSAHCPMYAPSSGDQVTRYVQRSLFIVHSPVCRWQAELAGLDKTLPCLWRFGYSRAGRPAKAFKDGMTCAVLPWRAKNHFAYLFQV